MTTAAVVIRADRAILGILALGNRTGFDEAMGERGVGASARAIVHQGAEEIDLLLRQAVPRTARPAVVDLEGVGCIGGPREEPRASRRQSVNIASGGSWSR